MEIAQQETHNLKDVIHKSHSGGFIIARKVDKCSIQNCPKRRIWCKQFAQRNFSISLFKGISARVFSKHTFYTTTFQNDGEPECH